MKPVTCPGSYIKPTMLRLQHRLTPTLSLLCSSPTSKACYAQAPTDILPPYIKPVMPRLLHHHPSPIYIKPIMPRFQHMLLTCIKPVMLRLLHHACYGQVPTCSNRYQACYSQAPTSFTRFYIKSDPLLLLHQAGYALASTIPSPTHTTNIPKFCPG